MKQASEAKFVTSLTSQGRMHSGMSQTRGRGEDDKDGCGKVEGCGIIITLYPIGIGLSGNALCETLCLVPFKLFLT